MNFGILRALHLGNFWGQIGGPKVLKYHEERSWTIALEEKLVDLCFQSSPLSLLTRFSSLPTWFNSLPT